MLIMDKSKSSVIITFLQCWTSFFMKT